MNAEEVRTFLLETMPFPHGCSLVAEASYHDLLKDGIMVRRNVRLEISSRLPPGLPRLEDLVPESSQTGIYEGVLNDICNEALEIIKRVSTEEGFHIRLSGRASERTITHYSTDLVLTLRPEFARQCESKTFVYMDFMAVVKCPVNS